MAEPAKEKIKEVPPSKEGDEVDVKHKMQIQLKELKEKFEREKNERDKAKVVELLKKLDVKDVNLTEIQQSIDVLLQAQKEKPKLWELLRAGDWEKAFVTGTESALKAMTYLAELGSGVLKQVAVMLGADSPIGSLFALVSGTVIARGAHIRKQLEAAGWTVDRATIDFTGAVKYIQQQLPNINTLEKTRNQAISSFEELANRIVSALSSGATLSAPAILDAAKYACNERRKEIATATAAPAAPPAVSAAPTSPPPPSK